MKKHLLILFAALMTVPVFGQTYTQSSGNICSAYTTRYYTFTNAPETPISGTLSVNWLYCGPNYNGSNYGRLYLYINVGGTWQTIANGLQDNGHGCGWVNDTFTLSSTTINNAINTAPGGEIEIRGYINDGCAAGYGCTSYSDPCFNATLTYNYAPDASFTANHTSTCLGGEVTFTNTSTGPQDSYVWNFGADAVPPTATGAGPHSVSWTSSGNKDVSLSVTGNGQTSTDSVSAYVEVIDAPSSVIFGSAFEAWQNRNNGASIATQKTIMDSNNNTYVAGTLSGSSTDVWLQKIDPSGTTLWDTSYYLSGAQSVYDLALDDTNNIYICGTTGNDYLVMKVNSNGGLAWNQAYSPSSGADVAKALCVDDNGDIFVTGSSYNASGSDATTVKFDNAGTYQFHITEADNGDSEGADILCYDGNVYVFGTMNVGGFNEDWLLIKYETVLGVEQWRQTINGTGYGDDNGHQMIRDGSNLYLYGLSDQAAGFGWTVARYNTSGAQSWKQDYFNGWTGNGGYDAIAIDQLGYLYLASTRNDGGDNYARVLQLNKSNGSQNWYSDFTGINSTLFRGIETGNNGTIYVAGVTLNNTGNQDLCIQQIDTSGTELWWAAYDGCGETTDHAVDIQVTSNNEGVLTGHNIQAVTMMYSPLVDPAASFSASFDTTCVGVPLTFTDASTGSTLSYHWNFGDGASIDSIFTAGPHEVSYSTPGVKTITLTVSNGLGDSTVTSTVEVFTLPALSTSGDESFCSPDSVLICGVGTGTFSWDNSLGNGMCHTVSPAIPTQYTVTLTDALGCTSIDSLTLTPLAPPALSTSGDVSICHGDSTLLEAYGAGTFEWDNGLGAGSSQSVMPSNTMDYMVTLTDSLGCSSMETITVTVIPLPMVEAGTDTSTCDGGSVTLTGSGSGTLEWSHGLGSTPNPTVSPANTTTYTLTVTDTMGCMNSDMVTISVFNLPFVSAGADQTICNGETATLTATGGTSYFWTGLGSGATNEVSPSVSTDYIVTASDSNMCASTDTVTVFVNPTYFMQESFDYCPGENHVFPDGTTWSNITSNIVYTSNLMSSLNCDSIIETTINVLDCSCDNPVSYSVSDIQPTQVTLHWNSEDLAIKYKLKIRQVGTNNWTYHTVWAPDTFKVKPNLMAGTDYEYKVQTICDENSPSGYGPFQYFSTASNPCSNPDSVIMEGINQTQTNASWTPVTGAISYKLKYRPVGSSNWKYKTVYAPQNYRNLYNLEPDTQYEYKIRTTCSAGSEPYGPFEYFHTLSCGIGANRSASNITANSATVSWDPVPGAVSYKVKYRINNTASWSYKNVTAPASSAQLNYLQGGTVYQWKVKTFCSPNSNYSNYSGNNLFATTGSSQARLATPVGTEDATINIFPNPTQGVVNIKFDGVYSNVIVTIRNVMGQIIQATEYESAQLIETELRGPAGMYTVEVLTQEGSLQVKRVVKE